MITLIAALDARGAIGQGNTLPWHLPADMKHFRRLTLGHTVLMGRRTFDSLPKGALPDRRNIVLTTRPDLECPGCLVVHSVREALDACRSDAETFVIGGREVYTQLMSAADRLCLTHVHHVFPAADVFFPAVDWHAWTLAEQTAYAPDEKNPYALTFATYVRRLG